MAKLADAQRSERCGLKAVEVRVLSRAHKKQTSGKIYLLKAYADLSAEALVQAEMLELVSKAWPLAKAKLGQFIYAEMLELVDRLR